MTQVTHVVGIDEVGRGPLAGPVSVCACAVPRGFDDSLFAGIRDSKKLSAQKRDDWFRRISELKAEGRLDFAVRSVSAAEIDGIGISKAIERALRECLSDLALPAETTQVLLDGSLRAPEEFAMQETMIKGDERIPVISAASIAAKVTRDRHMAELAAAYPGYGLDTHKGYGTAAHMMAIRTLGPTPVHRRSFLKKLLFSGQ